MREKLIKLLDDFSAPVMLMDTKLMDWNIPTQQLREAIADYLIANDVVPVVRCKDCKHWHEGTGWCDKHSHFVDRLGDFCYPEESGDWKDFDADYFCKDGERKDE